MLIITFDTEQNGYDSSSEYTQVSFSIKSGDEAAAREALAGYTRDTELERIISRVRAGECVRIRSTGGAANVRITQEGWTILVNDANQIPLLSFSLPGLWDLKPIEGLVDAEDGCID